MMLQPKFFLFSMKTKSKCNLLLINADKAVESGTENLPGSVLPDLALGQLGQFSSVRARR